MYKGESRPHLVHVDDLLTRTRCFKCGELGHLARTCSQKKEDDPSLFAGDKEIVTESETFFNGMALGDLDVETVLAEQEEVFLHDSNIDVDGDLNSKTVFAEQEEIFLPDSNIDEKEGTFLFDSNVEVRKETFLCYTNAEKKEETFLFDPNVEDEKEVYLYDSNTEDEEETFLHNTNVEEEDESSLNHQHVSSEDTREIVRSSGSDSKSVCPQKYFAGFDHRGLLVSADHLLFGTSLNLSAVNSLVRAGTTKLFLSGLFAGSAMEADTAELLSSGSFRDSPDAKTQLAIHIQSGVSVRAAYKAMRKRVRVEARRQRELEEVLQRYYLRASSSC